MDLILIRLIGPESAVDISPHVAADVIWATSIPDDRLEHITARQAPTPGTLELGIYLNRVEAGRSATETALALCRRAIALAPALTGWTAESLFPGRIRGPAQDISPITTHSHRTHRLEQE